MKKIWFGNISNAGPGTIQQRAQQNMLVMECNGLICNFSDFLCFKLMTRAMKFVEIGSMIIKHEINYHLLSLIRHFCV